MFKSYLKATLRHFTRSKSYTIINILGLALGMMSCILIAVYIHYELSYDTHFSRAGQIYRVVNSLKVNGEEMKVATTPGALAPKLKEVFPEIESVVRVQQGKEEVVEVGDKLLYVGDILKVDSNFFSIFDYTFLFGTPGTAFEKQNSVILTEGTAARLFGSAEAAFGQLLKIYDKSFQVTGVIISKAPSHLKLELLLPINTLTMKQAYFQGLNADWDNLEFHTYLLLHQPGQDVDLQAKLPAFFGNYVKPVWDVGTQDVSLNYHLQPLTSIFFDADWLYDNSRKGNISYLYIFGAVGAFILLIASINYINLATARSAKRAKEVGMRKAIGAYRYQIILQFLGESLLLSFVSLLLALVFVELFLPVLNTVTNNNIVFYTLITPEMLLAIVGMVLFIGLVAGSYPAFILSSFSPSAVLKSNKVPNGSNALLRKYLVIFQFTVSQVLILGTLVVYSQLLFLRNADLGFDQEQVVALAMPTSNSQKGEKLQILKEKLSQQPDILETTSAQFLPGEQVNVSSYYVKVDNQLTLKTLNNMGVDYNYLDLMGIELTQGRPFSLDRKTDQQQSFIINETAAKAFGWKDPIGKYISRSDTARGSVIGVVKDFNYTSMHHKVEPLILWVEPSSGYLLARLVPGSDPAVTISNMQSEWEQFFPAHPMEYLFLDARFQEQYQTEESMMILFNYFAILTIVIACMGLFGLASFTVEQRTREIGIRKVLGSSISQIILLLSRDFALLVLIAIVLACPIAWYGMNYWLQDFAYRTDLSWWLFLLAGLTLMAVALCIVSYKVFRAALTDPVKALRTD